MKAIILGIVGVFVPAALCAGSDGRPGLTVLQAANAADASAPSTPTIKLYDRQGQVTPRRAGFQHTGGGNIDVAQPSPDTVVITMTGVAVAGAHPLKDSIAAMDFDLSQAVEIGLDKP